MIEPRTRATRQQMDSMWVPPNYLMFVRINSTKHGLPRPSPSAGHFEPEIVPARVVRGAKRRRTGAVELQAALALVVKVEMGAGVRPVQAELVHAVNTRPSTQFSP